MSKAARRGKLEEIGFEEEARTWAGIQVIKWHAGATTSWRTAIPAALRWSRASSWTTRTRRPSRRRHQEADPRRQGTSTWSGSWSRGRKASFVSLTANSAGDRGRCLDSRTTRQWLPQRSRRAQASFRTHENTRVRTFSRQNSALAEEVRRTFVDLDDGRKGVKEGDKGNRRRGRSECEVWSRLQALCDNAAMPKGRPGDEGGICANGWRVVSRGKGTHWRGTMEFLKGIAKGLVGLIVLNIVLVPIMVLGPLLYVIPFFCIVVNPQDDFQGWRSFTFGRTAVVRVLDAVLLPLADCPQGTARRTASRLGARARADAAHCHQGDCIHVRRTVRFLVL